MLALMPSGLSFLLYVSSSRHLSPALVPRIAWGEFVFALTSPDHVSLPMSSGPGTFASHWCRGEFRGTSCSHFAPRTSQFHP